MIVSRSDHDIRGIRHRLGIAPYGAIEILTGSAAVALCLRLRSVTSTDSMIRDQAGLELGQRSVCLRKCDLRSGPIEWLQCLD